ncbi:MAG: alpha/beta fold hydrolase [Chloroflexota bacterium]
MTGKMIFLHGLESNSQTYKAGLIRRRFPDLIVPDFTGALWERMEALYPILGAEKDWTIIGSSFGGLMGAIFTCQHPDQVRRLILLAPALMLPEFASFLDASASLSTSIQPVAVPTTVIHGTADDVVPLEEVRQIAQKVFANLTYRIVDDDHRLHKTAEQLDWKALLA